jgi:isoleucyl-tRNA synthetase
MARDYEARTLEAFYGFLEKGFVYRGLKPVYWCIHDRTALAEAEVEYEMHTSPSVYVRYRLTSDPAAIDPRSPGREVSPSSGPPPRGRCPRRWPWPSIPTSSTWR